MGRPRDEKGVKQVISVGIDVGKRSFQACLKDGAGSILDEFSLPNDSLGARRLLEALKDREARAPPAGLT
ncbi:MAG: transposase [Candidatus Bathyarchaeia archaeon]